MQNYSVTLNPTLVADCQNYYKDSGGKLSPLLNKLLEDWLKLQKKKKNDKKDKPYKSESKKDNLGDDIDLLGNEVIA